jgi:hypothetical protein
LAIDDYCEKDYQEAKQMPRERATGKHRKQKGYNGASDDYNPPIPNTH